MPFESAPVAPRRIAIVGGGISGLGAAHFLAGAHRVTLYEADTRLGGHARTVIAGKHGDQPVDMGFIVFNHANYPLLTRLFEGLEVPVAKSDMSFGVSIDGGRFEYALRTPGALFAQKRNLISPGYLGMLRDILRFNARAYDLSRRDAVTVGALLRELRLGRRFREHYLLPFSGAIWSVPKEQILDFPARAMLDFFHNHALLGVTGQHQWYTVKGGSVQYVDRLTASLRKAGVALRAGAPVDWVRRGPEGALVKTPGAEPELYDEVIFATHSDQAMQIIADPTPQERASVGRIAYQPNDVVLHSDPSVMPRRRIAWSSWNYTEAAGKRGDRIGVSYWMNSLQPIPQDDPLFVSLNMTRRIREEHIHDRVRFDHPVYDAGALAAQAEVARMNGTNRTWFCGAWMKYGFHEDGLSSGHDVAQAILRRAETGMVAA